MPTDIFQNSEVLPLGTTFSSAKGIDMKVMTYTIIEIYRTYNSKKQLVKIVYDAEVLGKKMFWKGITHNRLIRHMKFVEKERRNGGKA